MPFAYRPMLAISADAVPDGDDWVVEVKWDGIRAAAVVTATGVQLVSRNGNDVTAAYPELAALCDSVPAGTVLDGEIVATDAAGHPSFELLQQRMHVRDAAEVRRLARDVPVAYLAFDVLVAGDHPVLDEPWSQRRVRLVESVAPGPNWRVPPAEGGTGGLALHEHTVTLGLEGVVAKRRDARYEPGRRSPSWRKVKHFTSQEFVVGGWVPGEGARTQGVGALVLGVHDDDGALVACGAVGSGFTATTLAALIDALVRIERPTSPFDRGTVPAGTRFVEPVIVVDVRFAHWTASGSLRAPTFRGVRVDIDPAQVQRISR